MEQIEARKDGIVYCVYSDESCLPNKEIIKSMKAAGYNSIRMENYTNLKVSN